MKKSFIILFAALMLTSCSLIKINTPLPRAVNTVNSITLNELNLDREDYEILKTVTAEGTIIYSKSSWDGSISIKSSDGEFEIKYKKTKDGWDCNHAGILKLGYLSNDYQVTPLEKENPEMVARRLAIYRLVNLVNEYGADGVLEPVISTNVESKARDVIFQTVVKAKLVKVKTNK